MSTLAIRLKEQRSKAKVSQQELAKDAQVHHSNIGRYERGEATPSAAVLNRIADALEVSPDFLINGTLQDKADSVITDRDLLMQFKKVEQLPEGKKRLVKEFLDAFLFKSNIQQQLV